MSALCILNIWKKTCQSFLLSLVDPVVLLSYKGRVLLVFHGKAVCLTFIVEVKYMMEMLTWVLVYIISVSQARHQGSYPSSKIITANANPIRYSSFGHDIWMLLFFSHHFATNLANKICILYFTQTCTLILKNLFSCCSFVCSLFLSWCFPGVSFSVISHSVNLNPHVCFKLW